MAKLKKVLLIDDDTIASFLNERIVRTEGIAEEVKVLHNGQQGLDYLTAHCGGNDRGGCPELVILDHYMPVMDGMELMESLYNSGRLRKMKTVFLLLGTHTNPSDTAKFKALGVQEFTNKPLSRERLLEVYRKYWPGSTVQGHAQFDEKGRE